MNRPAIIVHGGANTIPPEEREAYRSGCKKALNIGWEILASGGSALDAAEKTVRELESLEVFNAGYGAELNTKGEVQLDASIMEGREYKAGAVAWTKSLPHPISVARRALEKNLVLMVGEGASEFARNEGLELCTNADLITEKSRKELRKHKEEESTGGCDTVGCVALDSHGNLAAAASTGGLVNSPDGRVGDTPMVGCGIYADNKVGACSMTGDGEQIARMRLAGWIVDQLETRNPEVTARAMLKKLETVGGEAGCIIIDQQGRIGWNHNSDNMSVAYRSGNGEMGTFLAKKESQEHA